MKFFEEILLYIQDLYKMIDNFFETNPFVTIISIIIFMCVFYYIQGFVTEFLNDINS